MPKKSGRGSVRTRNDEPRVSREQMRRGTMGKYHDQVMAASNVVRIAEDVKDEFPNESAVNQALRELLQLRSALSGILKSGSRKKKSA